jgi:hypothetical protein
VPANVHLRRLIRQRLRLDCTPAAPPEAGETRLLRDAPSRPAAGSDDVVLQYGVRDPRSHRGGSARLDLGRGASGVPRRAARADPYGHPCPRTSSVSELPSVTSSRRGTRSRLLPHGGSRAPPDRRAPSARPQRTLSVSRASIWTTDGPPVATAS